MAVELESRICYFTFGRFQPPTVGHQENFAAVKKAAKGNDYRIYISQTVDNKGTNPLDPDTKLKYMIILAAVPVALKDCLLVHGYHLLVPTKVLVQILIDLIFLMKDCHLKQSWTLISIWQVKRFLI